MNLNFIRVIIAPLLALSFHVCADPSDFQSNISSDWIEVSADAIFSLMAPTGTSFHPAKGIDSFVGAFENPRFKLDFDYGSYSDQLTSYTGQVDYQARELQIDGKMAKIISYSNHGNTQHPYFIGVHFSDLKRTTLGTTKLTLVCRLK